MIMEFKTDNSVLRLFSGIFILGKQSGSSFENFCILLMQKKNAW